MSKERLVTIGFVAQPDLGWLGSIFTRHFPIIDDGMFDDLLEQLNNIALINQEQGDDKGTA